MSVEVSVRALNALRYAIACARDRLSQVLSLGPSTTTSSTRTFNGGGGDGSAPSGGCSVSPVSGTVLSTRPLHRSLFSRMAGRATGFPDTLCVDKGLRDIGSTRRDAGETLQSARSRRFESPAGNAKHPTRLGEARAIG